MRAEGRSFVPFTGPGVLEHGGEPGGPESPLRFQSRRFIVSLLFSWPDGCSILEKGTQTLGGGVGKALDEHTGF